MEKYEIPCCEQEENLQIKFVWAGKSKDDEGGYEPLHVYCTACGKIVKEIGIGGYCSAINQD
jgi:hypothetical protein